MNQSKTLVQPQQYIYTIAVFLCLLPFMSAPFALGAGLLYSFILGKKLPLNTARITSYLLQASIVFMGFGMNLGQVIQTSKTGFYLTFFSVFLTLLAGTALGLLFRVDKKTAYLISCGTAICGGSAIAATAPVIRAKNNQVSFALGVVFFLNAIALFIFPHIGHLLHMSQEHFGFWAAIAIHDTSSVVGAGSVFGPKALQVATTVKLTRTLWIIPVTLLTSLMQKKEERKGKIKIPWFIPLFILAIIAGNFMPAWQHTFTHFSWLGHKGLMIALFFIGTGISAREIKKAGWRPLLMGFLLWVIISVTSVLFLQ